MTMREAMTTTNKHNPIVAESQNNGLDLLIPALIIPITTKMPPRELTNQKEVRLTPSSMVA